MRFIINIFERFNVFTHKLTLIPQDELEQMPCSHCGAPSFEQWMQGCCADTQTRGTYKPLCVECDIQLNNIFIRFFHGDSRDDDLEKYAFIRRAQAAKRGMLNETKSITR